MKQLHLTGKGTTQFNDVPDPAPGDGEVLIEILYSALCGSELHGYREDGVETGNHGHEAIGVVRELGSGVDRVSVADRVGISAVAGCGKPDCKPCAAGQSTWCPDYRVYSGAHAELHITAQTACLALPEDVPDEVAVLISGDGMGVPYHTAAKLQADTIETIAIFGVGPIGLGNTLAQTHLGRRVLAVDVSPFRLDYAKGLGAEVAVNAADDDAVEAVRAWTGGRGADVCIEAAGRPETLKQCFKAVRTSGTVVMNGEQGAVELSPSDDFIRRDVTAVGSWFYHVGEFPGMLQWYRDGMPVRDMISDVFPFSQADEAFRKFAAGESAKVLLDMRR
jgi:propanol-preferring alcohol dehydrogenase